jgi:hypothetical protein
LLWDIINYFHRRNFVFILPFLKLLFRFLLDPEKQKKLAEASVITIFLKNRRARCALHFILGYLQRHNFIVLYLWGYRG